MAEPLHCFPVPDAKSASPTRPLRVVIADAHGLTRAGLRALLNHYPDVEVVAEAATGDEVVEVARATRPNAVVIDANLPAVGGLAATQELLQAAGVDVVLLLSSTTDDALFGALRAGAKGLLLKDAGPDELAAAVRAVAAGNAMLAPALARRLVEDFVARPRRPADTLEQLPELTTREREVLELVACGLSNEEISQRLVVTRATAKTHVSRILCKLDVRDRAQLVVLAYESGLVRPGAASDPAPIPAHAPRGGSVTDIGRARGARRRGGLRGVAA
jgi:DNA-binding NarL/FixJ family response regulator